MSDTKPASFNSFFMKVVETDLGYLGIKLSKKTCLETESDIETFNLIYASYYDVSITYYNTTIRFERTLFLFS